MEFIQKNWEWISSHPWLVITLALMFFLLGWKAATLFYKERIELLKEKQNGEKPANSEPAVFEYPQNGRYGKNILSNSVISIKKNEMVKWSSNIGHAFVSFPISSFRLIRC